ncbi:lipoprotein LpqH [Mycobacterium sp. IDR2000157661]|uniref:lipoprotein LpqH n=1 Tax=Mycobacterium sp. IDR2000157661 TaxID=2867005 RepID=UPI001EECECAD|nr:lipoprotein LpqH [Mycobacterium sp. IDR2000157661]ULE31611.1 lipoprotein LpqH [Mycobacterium sp. IDR2000157661]
MISPRRAGIHTLGIVLLAAAAGCGSEPAPRPDLGMPRNTAQVSIDGRDTGKQYVVSCRKQQWQLSIDTVGQDAGFTAMLDSDSDLNAEMVKIRDLGGFTGSAWRGGVGDVQAHRDAGILTINGTGYGYFGDKWTHPTNAEFTIEAAC